MFEGSCLCGKVTFQVDGPLSNVSACHCGQCRKNSGHHWASCEAFDADFRITSDDTPGWYQASADAKRGFCKNCGSFLFWKHLNEDKLSISMSAFDTPTGLKLQRHIFVADKGDYYDIADGLPQKDQ